MRLALMTTLLALALPAASDAATVRVADCVPSLDPAVRSATFEARVSAVRKTDRMQVRFTLQVRDEALRRWRTLAVPGFDEWLTSEPGVRRYSYSKTVTNLAAPASYRTIVRFRWLDPEGEAIRRDRATSARCRQYDLRPDLEPRTLDVLRNGDPTTRRYELVLRNAGRSDALPFAATLTVGSGEPASVAVLGVPAHAPHTLTFIAPPCTPGTPLTVTLDPGAAVDERDEDDNVLVVPCPAP
jgi:CARDB